MNWLTRINQSLVVLAALLLGAAALAFFWPQSPLPTPVPQRTSTAEEEELTPELAAALEAVDESIFQLKSVPHTLQLPDLRRHLLFYGANQRPDTLMMDFQAVHISLRTSTGARDVRSVQPEQPVYLVYVQDGGKESYAFSPDNAETGLWIEIQPQAEKKNARVLVYLRDQNDRVVVTPVENHEFTLTQRPLPRYGSNSWELGGQRVDANILVRQQARWYGLDRFLADHGGENEAGAGLQQSIRFEDGDSSYTVRLAAGDYLVWKDGRWQSVIPGEESIGYVLLMLESVEDRSLRFQLWDEEGKFNINVRLSRANERWQLRPLMQDLRFAGARTRTRMNLDIAGQRYAVQPQDWILYTEDGQWVPIDSVEKLDQYVDGSLKGMLLVIDEMDRSNGQQALKAHVYSPSRSDRKDLTLLLQDPYVVVDGPPPVMTETGTLQQDERPSIPDEAPPELIRPDNRPPEIDEGELRRRIQDIRSRMPGIDRPRRRRLFERDPLSVPRPPTEVEPDSSD